MVSNDTYIFCPFASFVQEFLVSCFFCLHLTLFIYMSDCRTLSYTLYFIYILRETFSRIPLFPFSLSTFPGLPQRVLFWNFYSLTQSIRTIVGVSDRLNLIQNNFVDFQLNLPFLFLFQSQFSYVSRHSQKAVVCSCTNIKTFGRQLGISARTAAHTFIIANVLTRKTVIKWSDATILFES